MKDITKQEQLEYAVLSHLVQFPEWTKKLLDLAAVEVDAFSSDARKAAFRALCAEKDTTQVVRMRLARENMPELTEVEFLDRFLDLAAASTTTKGEILELITAQARAQQKAAMNDIMGRHLDDPVMISDAVKVAMKEINDRFEAKRDALTTAVPPSDAPSTAAKDGETPGIYKTDESLLDVPGFINDLVGFTMSAAPRPNRVLAFAGALSFLAHLAGRRYVGFRSAFPNLYLVALADSATGKDFPRQVNKRLAAMVNISQTVHSSSASGQAIEDAVLRTPTLLFQLDEFDSMLREMKSDKVANTATESLWRTLLTFFTSSGSIYTTRVRASGANKGTGGEDIMNPSLSLFATAIPANFYGSLSQRALTGGLLGRCLVFEVGQRGEENFDSGFEKHSVPISIMRRIEWMSQRPPAVNDKGPIDPIITACSDEAEAEAIRISKESEELYHAAELAGDEAAKSVWGRSAELVGKLSLLYAISANERNPVITAEGFAWAWRLVKSLQLRMLDMVRDYAAVNELDEKVLAAMRSINKAGKEGIMRTQLARRLHVSKDEMDRIEATLEDRGLIIVEHVPSANGKGTRYKIRKGTSK